MIFRHSESGGDFKSLPFTLKNPHSLPIGLDKGRAYQKQVHILLPFPERFELKLHQLTGDPPVALSRTLEVDLTKGVSASVQPKAVLGVSIE